MKILFVPYTAEVYGGALKGNLRYLSDFIENELKKVKFQSSFKVLELTLAYLQMYIGHSDPKEYKEHYQTLPSSRLDRRYKKIRVSLQGPEFSENLNNPGRGNRKKELDVEKPYQNISEVVLGKIFIDKFLQAGEIITSKLKKDDLFDVELFRKVLLNIKSKINPTFLKSMHKNQEEIVKK